MFWNLCKYEFRSTWRSYMMMYAILLISAAIIAISNRLGSLDSHSVISLLFGAAAFIYFVALFVAIIFCFVNIVRSYNRSMFQKEAYLTHTLPIKPWQLLTVKMLSAFFWLIVTGIVTFFSLLMFAIAFSMTGFTIEFFPDMLKELGSLHLSATAITYLLTQCFAALGEITFSLLLLYTISTFVHSSFVQRYRTPIGIALFFVIEMALGFAFSFIVSSMKLYDPIQNNMFHLIVYWALNIGCFYLDMYLLKHKLEVA